MITELNFTKNEHSVGGVLLWYMRSTGKTAWKLMLSCTFYVTRTIIDF